MAILQVPLGHAQTREGLVSSPVAPATVSAGIIGSYRPNGRFKPDKKHMCIVGEAAPFLERPEVPRWIDLRDHSELVRENFAPRHRAVAAAHPTSTAKSVLSSVVAFAYGREALLHRPSHLAVDSKGRLIVVDPQLPAVHILGGDRSFRIVGGPGHRLQRPDGVAVDSDDRIYIADGKAGVVQVFDDAGTFLRSLGIFHGEPIFQEPTAVAIDGQHRRVLVLDSPANEVVILDPDGKVFDRIGGRRRRGGVDLIFPSEIAVRGSSIVVLDSSGSRLHIFDLDGKLAHVFQIGVMRSDARPHPMGLSLDSADNVYVSNGGPDVKIYNHDGKLRGLVSNCGRATPGIWIDATGRIYLADPSVNQVHVLQLPPAGPAAGHGLEH